MIRQMRVKKFRQILELLPDSEELKKVTNKLDDKAKKTADFMADVRKWAKYLTQLYFLIFWAVQNILNLGLV